MSNHDTKVFNCLSDKEMQRIWKLHTEDKVTLKNLAKRFGVSYGTIERVLRKFRAEAKAEQANGN